MVRENLITNNQIEITQVDNPHKFWYKRCKDSEQLNLSQLEEKVEEYVQHLYATEEQSIPIERGDVVAAFHPQMQKWIRAKAGRIKCLNKAVIEIWAIDYGCTLTLELDKIVLLKDRELACKHPINVHIGGLVNISPAKEEFNVETLGTDVIKTDTWSIEATEKFEELIYDRKIITFKVSAERTGHNFGRLLLHGDGNSTPFCVAKALCDLSKCAIRDKKFLNGVQVLDREDFWRLNHHLTFEPQDEVDFDENAAERIMANGDSMSSVLDLDGTRNQDNLSLDNQSNQHNGQGNGDINDRSSVDEFESASQHRPSTHSGAQGLVSIAESAMSTDSLTLSVKTLNKLNLLVITEDDVIPAEKWSDACYFTKQMISNLMQLYPHGIDAQCSYAWPHIMRTNSLLLIGETDANLMLCLPTICSMVYRIVTDWVTSIRIEPIAIIFVSNAEEVDRVARLCRNLFQKSKMDNVEVFCLNSSFEIRTLVQAENIDILVTTVFCFQAVANELPSLFRSKRLQFIWFHQIDEMYLTNETETFEAVNAILGSGGMDIQVVATSKNYCLILDEVFHKVKLPMLSIGNRSPFEAALFAKSYFKAELLSSGRKAKHLIGTLRDVDCKLTGSIIIMCANQMDVKHVTGSLTQANIKCTDFSDQYSGNQMKLVNWTKRCLSSQHNLKNLNILVCDDENLRTYPIRTAAHIVHYSLPNKLETFMERYITCYGFYEERLCRELLQNEGEADLNRPFSLVYFDDNHSDEYIETYELLLNRANCELPSNLTEIVQEMRYDYELRKMKPLCTDLITKAKDCDMSCPYRHVLTRMDESSLPGFGFVNMDLLEVITPNHFAVRLISHKRNLRHKSRAFDNEDEKWERFDEELREHFANGQREKHNPVEIGDMCMIFHENQPLRCRVLSKTKKNVSVYLVDIGRVRKYHQDNLYRLNVDLQDFPSKAIEIFVLGYQPSNSNPTWLPEAKEFVDHLMKSLKDQRTTENYLQAEVLRTFGRTLIVKDLKLIFRGKQHQFKAIDQSLVRYSVADKVPIRLHDVFLDLDSDSDESDTLTVNSEIQDTKTMKKIDLNKFNNLNIAVKIPASSNGHNISQQEDEKSDNVSFHSKAFSYNTVDEPAAPPNSANILENGIVGFMGRDEFDAAPSSKHPDEIEWDEVIARDFPAPISASLDEIFGSLPDNVQADDVLEPIKCESISVDTDEKPAIEECDWLIDFSDNDDNATNFVALSPFSYVRVINSIDDLL